MGGVYNTVKAGSTVPLKFEVFAGTTELTSTSIVKGFRQDGCCDGSAEDGSRSPRPAARACATTRRRGQFIQNWQTPKAAGSCYTVTVTMQDGSSISATFKLK